MFYMKLNSIFRTVAAIIGGALLVVASAPTSSAQLIVTPSRIMLSPSTRSGELEVKNPTSKPVVVTTRLMYAVTNTDSLGRAILDTARVADGSRRIALDWTRAFPKQFTLEPGATRLVKVLASPPSELADGEWLARIEVLGVPVDKPTELEPDTSGMSVRLNYSYAYNIPILYRKGELSTGIDFRALDAKITDKGASMTLGLSVTGNASYRGKFIVTVSKATGEDVQTFEAPVVATIAYKYPLAFPPLDPGTYTVTIKAVTQKRGPVTDVLIQAPPVTRQFTLTLGSKDVSVASK